MPMYYPMLDLISRFKHVPPVHARGNKWGGFLLSVLASVLCFSVLSFPVLDGIVVTASVFALSCR